MRRKRFTDIALLAAGLLLVMVMAALRASLSSAAPSVPSTYDAGLHGYAALYSFLGREGVRVSRFEEPPPTLFRRRGALVIAGERGLDAAAGSARQAKALDAWVRRGAALVLIGEPPSAARSALGLPERSDLKSSSSARGGCGLPQSLRGISVAGSFATGSPPGCNGKRATLLQTRGRAVALAYRRGKGTVIAVYSTEIFDNAHLSRSANAAFAYAIFSTLGPVAFNERVYGHAAGRSFWQVMPVPMRVALALAVFALLAGIAGANLPFVPPYAAPKAGGRDSGEYIASLARLLDRGGARRETIARLCGSAADALRSRAAADPSASALLDEARRLQHLLQPRSQDVLAAGQLFARVRKDYP